MNDHVEALVGLQAVRRIYLQELRTAVAKGNQELARALQDGLRSVNAMTVHIRLLKAQVEETENSLRRTRTSAR